MVGVGRIEAVEDCGVHIIAEIAAVATIPVVLRPVARELANAVALVAQRA